MDQNQYLILESIFFFQPGVYLDADILRRFVHEWLV